MRDAFPWDVDCPDQFTLKQINRLATPLGQKFFCDITELSASFVLQDSNMNLYFVSKEDAILSWNGIIKHILPHLKILKTKSIVLGSKILRKQDADLRMQTKKVVIQKSIEIALTHFKEKHPRLALPGALLALKTCKEVHGDDDPKCVNILMLLAKIFSAIGNVPKAVESISLAKYICMSSNIADPEFLRNFHSDISAIQMENQQFSEAIDSLSLNIVNEVFVNKNPISKSLLPSFSSMHDAFHVLSQTHKKEAERCNFRRKRDSVGKYLQKLAQN